MISVGEISEPMTNREFRAHTASQRMSLGMFAELCVGMDCARRGYIVLYPHHPAPKYDMVVDTGTSLLRVQIKVASKHGLGVNLGVSNKEEDYFDWNSHQAPMPKKVSKYKSGDFDYLAIVDRDSLIVYYVPAGDIDFSKPNVYIKTDEKERYTKF
jgi:hypothetical protein